MVRKLGYIGRKPIGMLARKRSIAFYGWALVGC